MKAFYFSLIGLYFFVSATAQPEPVIQPQHFLWEVSGNGLAENSYLLGSCQFNHPDLFHFSDSLFLALQSCEYFAGETDFSQMDSLILMAIQEEAGEEEEGLADDSLQDSFLDYLHLDGGPSLLDNFIYQAAYNLGLKGIGLEPLENQLDFRDRVWEKKSRTQRMAIVDEFLELFVRGDSLSMEHYLTKEGEIWRKVLNMKKRNSLQADKYAEAIQVGPTFGVLGIAHLLGSKGVLQLLKKKGFEIRRVGLGSASREVAKAYEQRRIQEWYTLSDETLGLELQSNLQIPLLPDLSSPGTNHYTSKLSDGLMFVGVFKPRFLFEDTAYMEAIQEAFFPDIVTLKLVAESSDQAQHTRLFEGQSKKMPFRAQLVVGQRLVAVQLVFGFSEKSLLSPLVDRYFAGLKLDDHPMPNWERQESEIGAFSYDFPSNIPFSINTGQYPGFEERGKAQVHYKAFIDTLFDEEYLVRYSNLPSGATYTHPYQAHPAIIQSFSNNFSAPIEELTFLDQEGMIGAKATLVDSFDNHFYVHSLIRGAELYVLLQKSQHHVRNVPFFASLKLAPAVLKLEDELEYPAAKFKMKAPTSRYAHKTEEEEEEIDNYEFNIPNTGISYAIQFRQLSPYAEANFHDSLFTYENMVNESEFDSLIGYEAFHYGDICPAYRLTMQNDSTALHHTTLGIFCNNHEIKLDISSPAAIATIDAVSELIASIDLEVDENSLSKMTAEKDMKILTDLTSQDTSTFQAAVAAFNEYENFTADHLPAICELLPEQLLDEGLENSAKYDIITKLHAFEMAAAENALVDYYPACEDKVVKARIVESLSMRTSETAIENLWKVLEQTSKSQALPENVFSSFVDSLALFQQYYPRFKRLIGKDVARSQALELIVNYLEDPAARSLLQADSLWLRTHILEDIEAFKLALGNDPEESIDSYIMDYLLETKLDEEGKTLYQLLSSADNTYGKYRVVHNSLLQNELVADNLLEQVMANDYYRFWTMKAFHQIEKDLPVEYAAKEEVAKAIMKHYIYDKLDYQSEECTIIRVLPADASVHDGNLLFMRCSSEEEGTYYLGCVGPFDEDGKFDFDKEKSAYFNTPQHAPDPEERLQILLDYIDKQ